MRYEIKVGRNHVIAERDRRLAKGVEFIFQDARGKHRFGATDSDMAGWSEVSEIANALIKTGQPGGEITISTETGIVKVTANEWQDIVLAIGEFRQPILVRSFELSSMTSIPTDFAVDARWQRKTGEGQWRTQKPEKDKS